jgi:hypothetical protein
VFLCLTSHDGRTAEQDRGDDLFHIAIKKTPESETPFINSGEGKTTNY